MALSLVDFFDLRYDHRNKSPVIFLKDTQHEKYLPVWIGELEANSIERAVISNAAPRPMTHDLIVNMLRDLDCTVEKVVIDRLESRTYFATLIISQNGRTVDVDCRPSDAIAIALRENASIYVDDELMYSIKFVELREGGNDDDEDSGDEGKGEVTDTVSFQDFLKNISPADFKDN